MSKTFLSGIKSKFVTDLDDPILPKDAVNKSWIERILTDFSVNLTNGIPTYVNGNITRIDYDNSKYKTFTYTNGNVTQIDIVDGSITYRKTLSYNSSNNWTGTVEGYL